MLVAALALTLSNSLPAEQRRADSCQYDRSAMLALDERAFDQDMHGGWRALAGKGCDGEAADLIRDWRQAHGLPQMILSWHEGQMRANAGQYRRAIELFQLGRHPGDDNGWGWNLYVDGSVAFLRGDRAGLELARAQLAALPEPEGFKNFKTLDGKPSRSRWPLNLNVLDGLIRCWGKPYRDAYSCPAASSPPEN